MDTDNLIDDERPLTLNMPTVTTKKLGMISGVTIPCILSMFSIVLFLRVGYLVGYVGIVPGLLILGASYFIVMMTVLSLCALCTNGTISSGGAYYMISRTLGPEFGASIGIMFFLANIASCALYILGLTETILANFGIENGSKANILPESYFWNILYASSVLLFCTVICTLGSQLYSKSVGAVFLVVFICICSIYTSFLTTKPFLLTTVPRNASLSINYTSFSYENFNQNLNSKFNINTTPDYLSSKIPTFMTVFAVFFNGCIGVMAGVNVSGELQFPEKAIPKGTIIAVMSTFVIYIGKLRNIWARYI